MAVKIKGLKKLKRELTKSLSRVSLNAAVKAKSEIQDNLRSSNKSGALSKSFKIRKGLGGKSRVFSNLPYAAIQNYGGRIRVTKRMQGKMWALYKRTKLPLYKAIATTKKTFLTIPAKNYLKVNRSLISRYANKKLQQDLNKIK